MLKGIPYLKEKRIKRFAGFTLILIIILALAAPVHAIDVWQIVTGNDDLKTFYANNAKIMKNHSIGGDVIRMILWALTSLLANIAHFCNGIYDIAFGFIDWTANPKINNYVNSFKPLLIALMVISLIYLGIVLIISHEKKPKIMVNIMLAVLCVTCSTALFEQLNSFTLLIKDQALSKVDDKRIDQAYSAVGVNLIDLIEVDKANSNGLMGMDYSSKKGIAHLDTLTEKEFDKIDFKEVLNEKSSRHSYKSETKRILGHRLITDSGGDVIVEVDNGFGWNSSDDADIGNEFYYRYYLDWMAAWLELMSLIIIYLTMSYKCVRVIFELIVGRLLAYLYSAELSGGEKLKKILVFIRDSYILLIVTALCIKVYLFMSVFLTSVADIGGFVKGLFCLFIAFSVIDGPNLVEKLLGMDVGLGSSIARSMALGRAVVGIGKAASPKAMAQRAQGIKSGYMSQGGLSAGVVGVIAGKEVHNNNGSTYREGGFLNRIRKSDQASSDGSGSAGNNTGGSVVSDFGSSYTPGSGTIAIGESGSAGASNGGAAAGRTVQGPKGDKGDKGEIGYKGDRGTDGRDGSEQSVTSTAGADYSREALAAAGSNYSQGASQAPVESGSVQRSHDFMNSERRSAGSESSRYSSMPRREISSSSNILKDKKGSDK